MSALMPVSRPASAAAADRGAPPALVPNAEAWVDLFAAGLLHAGLPGDGPAAVLTDRLHALPLLESQGPVAWVHTSACHYRDFVPVPHGQPAPRLRIEAGRHPAEAAHVLQRARLGLASVPASRAGGQAMAALALQALQARVPLLLYGPREAAGWAALDPVIRQGALQPVHHDERPGHAQVLASAGLAGTLGEAGFQDGARALALATALARARQADLHAERLGDGRLRLRLRIDPLRLVAAGADAHAHHIAHTGRALFNARGLGALLLPWAAACQARLLLRNVRARIHDSHIALGDEPLAPTAVDYTEHGAMLRLALPAAGPGRDALLHLSLPREAVPGDGFCDIGAAEFTVETT